MAGRVAVALGCVASSACAVTVCKPRHVKAIISILPFMGTSSNRSAPRFVRPGKLLFEMEGVPVDIAKEAMRLAAHKLGLKTSFVVRPGVATEVAAK